MSNKNIQSRLTNVGEAISVAVAVVNLVGTGADILSRKYDGETINKNIHGFSEYVVELAPIIGGTIAGYFLLPQLCGATAFATLGTKAAAITAYKLGNVGVLSTGIIIAANKMKEISDNESIEIDKEKIVSKARKMLIAANKISSNESSDRVK